MFISNTSEEKKEMLSKIGENSFDDLIKKIIPEKFLNPKFNLPPALNEMEAYNKMKELSKKNVILKSFVGGGVYERYIPSAIKAIVQRTEFLTAYTPYQAEASQGILQTIYEYQSIMAELYGMDFSNASMYDGSTAFAEAIKACVRINGKNKIVYSSLINPKYIDVIKTYFANSKEYEFVALSHKDGITDLEMLERVIDDKTACCVISNPNYLGFIEDIEEFNRVCKSKNILTVALCEPLSLAVLKSPGEAGFDFAVGEGQSLGLPLSYGGPYLGIFTCKKEYLRQMPGRICGMTTDKDGKRGFTLTLQAREQHIRREKAPSNICSNQALCALWASIYVTLLGKKGLYEVASLNNWLANYAYEKLKKAGIKIKYERPFFNEFPVNIPDASNLRKEIACKNKIDIGLNIEGLGNEFKDTVLMAFTETKTTRDIDEVVDVITSAVKVSVK